MKTITCIIIEDQAPAQRVLQKYVQDLAHLNLLGTFNDALSAIAFLNTHTVDLIFLDIHLPKISGIDFLNILHPRPQIILTTAFSEYAVKSYELDVIDYLLKPFSFERFVKAVSKVSLKDPVMDQRRSIQNTVPANTSAYTFIKTGSEYLRLEIDSIQFIKSEGDYTRIICEAQKYLAATSLKQWLEQLPHDRFCQVHKSYLVNTRHITKVAHNQIHIGAERLPVGRAYKENFVRNYLERR